MTPEERKAERNADWRRRYEAGASLNDIAAEDCARGLRSNSPGVRAGILEAGGSLRTHREALAISKTGRRYPSRDR